MRAFTAIELPGEIKAALANAAQDFALQGVTLVKEEAMHVTLHFLGEIEESDLGDIENAMDRAKVAPFEVAVRGISFFTPRYIRVIFAEVAEGADRIKEIYAAISARLENAKIGFDKEERYVPHITLARVKTLRDRHALLDAVSKHHEHEFGRFTVDSIALRKSTLTGQGPVYDDLYRLKL